MDIAENNLSLSISFSEDHIRAFVSGYLNDDEEISLECIAKKIQTLLEKNHVTYGIQDDRIESIVKELVEEKFVDNELIAIGKSPQKGCSPQLQFTVATYSKKNFNNKLKLDGNTVVHYAKLLEHVNKPYLVKDDEVVGRFTQGKKGEQGTTVLGDIAETPEMINLYDKLGPGLMLDDSNNTIIACFSGILVLEEEYAFVLPIVEDGIAHLEIAEDKLSARLFMVPSGPQGKKVSLEDVKDLLKNHAIIHGIQVDAVQKALVELNEECKKIDGLIIAEGTPPIPGKDGKIKHLVNITFSQKPEIKLDGRADYYAVHTFEMVEEGQSIVKLLPPTKGVDGMDIYGLPIHASTGNDATVKVGKNVGLSNEDPTIIIAKKKGHVYLKQERLIVEEVLYVEENVDFSSGNIDYHGDIVVKGDVQSGFSVKSKGTIHVLGTVEDATIESGGCIIIHEGYVGKGRGRIKANEDVVVKYVLNQTIIAKKDIMIACESLDGKLYAGNQILLENKNSWLIGGVAVARNRIVAYDIGNTFNNRTIVLCGTYLFIQHVLDDLQAEIGELKKEIGRTKRRLKMFSNHRVEDTSQGKLYNMLEQQVEHNQNTLKTKNELYKKNNKVAKAIFNEESGDVAIIGTIFPNVTIKIGHHTYKNHDMLQRVLFQVFDGIIQKSHLAGF